MKMKVKFLSVLIRRDAHTTTPTIAADHELPILRSIYGKESVIVDNSSARAREIDTDGEYARLANKFGLEALAKVYGDEEAGRLDDALKAYAPAASQAQEGGGTDTQGAAGAGRGRRKAATAPATSDADTQGAAGAPVASGDGAGDGGNDDGGAGGPANQE